MISPIPSTPPLPPSKNTPPRHDSTASRIQEDDGEGSLLNRMREVVLTHYRNSPSAPDRPIDLTHFKDTSTTLTSSLSTNHATQTSTTAPMSRDMPPSIPMPSYADTMYDDDDEEYVPPGLADFVANVNRELEQQQNAFLNDPSNIIIADRADVEDMFYTENQTFETVPTDEHNTEYTDEESSNEALKKDILQRCDLLQRDVLHSDYNQEHIGIGPSRIDHALTWSPDIFTSPTPINPVSLLTVSQIKHQVFTSPIMTPIPPPPKNGSQTDKEMRQFRVTIHEEPPTSPLHALPQFTLSETNRCMKSSPANVKEHRSDDTLPHSLENIRLLPSDHRTESNISSVDQSLSCGQEVLLIDERTELSQHDANHQYSEDQAQQPNLATASVSQDTPSTLSMASPSKGMTEKINQTRSPPQPLGHRVSSPIYGYAPSPEYNAGMVHGIALPHPPPPLHNPPMQMHETNRSLSLGALTVKETTHGTPHSPSAGSLLERATKRLQSASQCDESEAKSIGVKPVEVAHQTIPSIQRVKPIVHAESQEKKKTMTPSPKQKFTNRPPQNKPISTPSPLPSGNSITRTGNETQRNPQDRQSDSNSKRNYSSPTKASLSPSLAVSETPSPLSMSSPGGYDTRSAFVPSSTTRKSEKKVGASPVPRFRTPPSPSRVKTAPRFTAEAAERLSRPSKSPQPPIASARRSVPHYASPLKKSVKAHKHVPSVVVPLQVMRKSPMISPPVCNSEIITMDVTTKAAVTKLSISSINRLAAPSSTESRRRAVVENSGMSKLEPSTKKTLTSPPIVHPSSNGPIVSAKSNRTSNSPIPQRRSADRIRRSKSLKTGGRISPRVAMSQPSTERMLSIDVSKDKETPRNDSQFTPSYKLSNGFEKSFRLNVSNSIQDQPHATLPNASNSAISAKSKSSDIIDRLSRPTQARAIAINCTLNPLPTDEEVEEQIPVIVQRSPSPFIMTTVERLTKPTIARKAAMRPLKNAPRQPATSSRPGVTGKDGRRLPIKNSESILTDQAPKLPSRLDSSSHLLTATAVSIAKKTFPKKATLRPPTPTRFVSGASDRLTKPTASYRAGILSRTAGSIESHISSGKNTSENANILKHDSRHPVSAVGRSSHVVPRTLTVPRGPRCANLPPSNTQHRSKECIDPPSLAQVLKTFGKGLRDDYSVGSAGSNFSRRSLTIPTGPTLATDIRGGEKYKQPKMNSDVTLADSNTLLQNGLRSPYHSKQGRQHKGPTIPISPKFAVLPSRKPQKSRSDLEAEEMEYSKDHQFKAKPPLHSTMHHSSSHSQQPNKVPGFMRPTKAASVNSREISHSSAARTQSAVTLNKSSSRMVVHKHRQVGLPRSIVTTNLGYAQRVPVHDDGLKDLVEQAARAANVLAIREEARQEKLVQEELERRELATFKAKPIPRTTYEYNPVVPAPTVPLVEPFSPELQTKQRMKERKAFDEYAEHERLAKMEREQAIENVRRADEEEEIKERRRLPVSEGGMIPVAAPINAVL